MSNKNVGSNEKKMKKQLFYIGLLIFSLGVILVFMGVAVPSPFGMPTQQGGDTTYFWPFLNYMTILGIVVSVAALIREKKKKNA
jgi:uncharacterized membrane protein